MDGATMEMTAAKSMRTVAQALLNVPYSKSEPIKFVAVSTGKQFYFDKPVLEAFVQDELTELELIEKLQCDGLYRNTEKITVSEQTFIPIDSLFKRIGSRLLLVDDDQFYEHHYPDENFVEV